MNVFVLRMILAVAVSAVFSLTANAQAPYPNQGVRFIVPYAPGGLPDTVARIVGQHLQERIASISAATARTAPPLARFSMTTD